MAGVLPGRKTVEARGLPLYNRFVSPGPPDLFVVCKNCQAEVSPYITECPYCGNRSVKLVPAIHDSRTPKGAANLPAGLVIDFKGTVVYHLGDTALFSDLQLVGKRRAVDIALICIGGHYTMDRHDAVDAADFVGAKTIIPCHYGTFPAIETDAGAFQTDIEKTLDATCVVLEPGAVHQA